jgi:AraC family transcriptional regulator, transcriptional activator of pobA
MEKIPVRHITNAPLKEPDFSGSFNIRDIEELLSGKDMVQELHRHSFFYVLALDKGRGEHSIDFTTYSINDNTVFFMRPGQVHELTLKNGSTGYLMAFNNDFYSPEGKSAIQILRKVSSKNYCQLDSDGFKKLLSLLNFIFREFTGKQERYREVIKSSLDIFFVELFRQSQNSQSPRSDSSQYRQERLEELLELLDRHISKNKQVAQYAEMLHLTTYQLNALTKETMGKTCSELINEYIVMEARRYLLATSNQINQIAYYLGYEDVSYFIRFFKKHTGFSPEAYRYNFR